MARLPLLALALALVAAMSAPMGSQTGDDLPPGGTFTDDNGSVHEGNIEALVEAGLTDGCNPPIGDRYCPDDALKRDQMAAFLRRAQTVPRTAMDFFVDDDGSIFERDINAVAAAGITEGCNPPLNDRYCPNSRLTRGQFATMLTRTFGYDIPEDQDRFVDTAGSVHHANIAAVAAQGVTVGCNPPVNDRFCPGEPVSRAQLASFLARALDLTPIIPPPPPPPPPPPGSNSCITGSHSPDGRLDVVSGESEVTGSGTVWEFRVEIERGLGVDAECFAEEVLRILNDPKGWGADGDRTFQRVDGSSAYDFRLILASPSTTDSLCAPVPTGGIYSCRNGTRVVLNQWRWQSGAAPFGGDLTTYRQYLVNHEVGHRLGLGHRGCSSSGSRAPVMMQQTKFVSPCTINGWPLPSERAAAG